MERSLHTYIAHRVLTNGVKEFTHDLKTCLRDISLKLPKNSGSSDWGTPELTERQLCYAAHDVRHMHELMRKYEEYIDEPGNALRTCWNLECSLAPIVVSLINRGFPVNLSQLPTIKSGAETRLAKAETPDTIGFAVKRLCSFLPHKSHWERFGHFQQSTAKIPSV